jgi:hypothetical protein
VNPLQHLLAANGALATLSHTARDVVTGREFFPHLISGPFHHGLVIVFALSAGLAALAAVASLLRGGHNMATTADPGLGTLATPGPTLSVSDAPLTPLPTSNHQPTEGETLWHSPPSTPDPHSS